jgi:hypothetical protein
MFSASTSVFPCRHSTTGSWSFKHVSPTLYNLILWQLNNTRFASLLFCNYLDVCIIHINQIICTCIVLALFHTYIRYLSAVHHISSVRYFYVWSWLVVILLIGLICCPVVSQEGRPSDRKVSYSNHRYISENEDKMPHFFIQDALFPPQKMPPPQRINLPLNIGGCCRILNPQKCLADYRVRITSCISWGWKCGLLQYDTWSHVEYILCWKVPWCHINRQWTLSHINNRLLAQTCITNSFPSPHHEGM